MKLRNLLVIAGAALMAASSVSAVNSYMFGFTGGGTETLTLNGGAYVIQASTAGWIDNTGSNNGGAGNYIVGNCAVSGCFGTDGEYRDYFVFDLSNVVGSITSASLSLSNPSNGFGGAPATYTNWDVTTPIGNITQSSLATYADLGSGILYGSTAVGAFDNGTVVGIALNGASLTAIQNAEGQQFAIGGALNGGTVPEPATWALMLTGLGGMGAVLRRRRTAVSA